VRSRRRASTVDPRRGIVDELVSGGIAQASIIFLPLDGSASIEPAIRSKLRQVGLMEVDERSVSPSGAVSVHLADALDVVSHVSDPPSLASAPSSSCRVGSYRSPSTYTVPRSTRVSYSSPETSP